MANLENFRLVVFRAVAEQLSFRKAAEQLYLTQPAVSLQIKALEEELNVQLFHRIGSQVSLSAAGEVLLRFAHQVEELARHTEEEIAQLGGLHAGDLSLGVSTTILQYILPPLLAEFKARNPRVQIRVVGGNTEDIVDLLEQRKIALGLIEGPPRRRDVKVESFLLDELVLIVAGSHEWAERATVQKAELTGVPLILRERGSGTRHIVELALQRAGIPRKQLQVVMELDSTEAIKSSVEAGLGVGFVSRWALAKDVRAGKSIRVIELEGLRMQRNLLLARSSGLEPETLVEEFRRFVLARTSARADLVKR